MHLNCFTKIKSFWNDELIGLTDNIKRTKTRDKT